MANDHDARAEDRRLGELRALHRSRGEGMWFCTCSHPPTPVGAPGRRVCPRCAYWVDPPAYAPSTKALTI